MTTHHGKTGVAKVGDNTVAEVDNWNFEETVDTVDDTAQGDTAQTHLPGIPGASGSMTCHWDPSDTNGQQAMTIGASVVLNLYPGGAGSGATYYSGTATITKRGVSSAKGAVVSRDFSFTFNGAVSELTV